MVIQSRKLRIRIKKGGFPDLLRKNWVPTVNRRYLLDDIWKPLFINTDVANKSCRRGILIGQQLGGHFSDIVT